MHVHTLIVGAGPGGLACAEVLAKNGKNVLVTERKKVVGPKVCAGGITWSGLISRVPANLAEKSFPVQYIKSPLQSISIKEKDPIIATVNRKRLGQQMAEQAKNAGASIRTATAVVQLDTGKALLHDKSSDKKEWISFDYLVGADGSSSLVRRSLGIPSTRLGIGINYQIPGDVDKMEWHLSNALFKNGYAWIFPHSRTLSIGAYADRASLGAAELKKNLLFWAKKQGYQLTQHKAHAEYINYDYQGWCFKKVYLVGDAAGLASGLTGEGIYPAIISGEETARSICDPHYTSTIMTQLVERHAKHSRMVTISGKSGLLNAFLAELMTLGLRSGMIKFNKMEMAI